MKNILIILLILVNTIAFAATRTISNTGGNWNSTGTWVEGSIPTNTDDVVATATSGAVTVAAAGVCKTLNLTGYTSTLTVNNTLTVSGNITLGGTITGSSAIIANAACTLTSNTLTIGCDFTIAGTVVTLADDAHITGILTFSTNATAKLDGAYDFYTNGGIIVAVSMTASGTSNIIVTGGTLTSNAYSYMLRNNLTLNSTDTITIGATFSYGIGTLTYTAGTIDVSTNNSTLYFISSCTANVNGITWNNIYIYGALIMVNLTSDLSLSGRLYVFTTRNGFSSATNKNINLTGTQEIINATFTNITASGKSLWTYGSSSSITNCTNIFTMPLTPPVYQKCEIH